MNTRDKGERAEIKILTALIERGDTVSVPWGDNQRYDLIWDNGVELARVQVKSGRLRDGVIQFDSISNSTYYKPQYEPKGYKGQVEYFGVYCPDNDQCYIIPIDDVPDGRPHLRVEATKNGQTKNIRWAKDYQVGA